MLQFTATTACLKLTVTQCCVTAYFWAIVTALQLTDEEQSVTAYWSYLTCHSFLFKLLNGCTLVTPWSLAAYPILLHTITFTLYYSISQLAVKSYIYCVNKSLEPNISQEMAVDELRFQTVYEITSTKQLCCPNKAFIVTKGSLSPIPAQPSNI